MFGSRFASRRSRWASWPFSPPAAHITEGRTMPRLPPDARDPRMQQLATGRPQGRNPSSLLSSTLEDFFQNIDSCTCTGDGGRWALPLRRAKTLKEAAA
nr:unnamed protein product [Digitaria exilis]